MFNPIQRPQLIKDNRGWGLWYNAKHNGHEYNVFISFNNDDLSVIQIASLEFGEIRVHEDCEFKSNQESLLANEDDPEIISAWYQRHMTIETVQIALGLVIELYIRDAQKRWDALQYIVSPERVI